MGLLFKKIFRYIRGTIGQFLSIFVIILIGSFFLAGMMAGADIVNSAVLNLYEECNLADSEANYLLIKEPALNELAADSRFTCVEGRNVFYAKTRSDKTSYDLTIYTITNKINKYILKDGAAPVAGEKQCLIDEIFAEERNIKPGDRISFEVSAIKTISVTGVGEEMWQNIEYETISSEFTVSGTYYGADMVRKVNLKDPDADPGDFGFMLVYYDDAPLVAEGASVVINGFPVLSLNGTDKLYTQALVTGAEYDEDVFKKYTVENAEQLTNVIKDKGAGGLFLYGLGRDDFPSVAAFDGGFEPIEKLTSIIPVIFYLVAAIITVIALAKTVDNERNQIGIMQALGLNKGAIAFSYIFYALFAAGVGSIVGSIIGEAFIPQIYGYIFSVMYTLPNIPMRFIGWYILAAVLISCALAVISSLLSLIRILKEKPAAALRPRPPKKTHRTLIERWRALWSKLGFGQKMNIRNMSVHLVKMLLSSVGIIGCMMLLLGMLALKDRIDYSLDVYKDSVNYNLMCTTDDYVDVFAVDFDDIVSKDTTGDLDKITFVSSLTADVTKGDKTESITVAALPSVDTQGVEGMSTETVKINLAKSKDRLEIKKDTFALCESLADSLKVKAGDTVSLRVLTASNRYVTANVKVTDITEQYLDRTVYTSYELFKDNDFGVYSNKCFINVKEGADLDNAINFLREYPGIRSVHTSSTLYANIKNNLLVLNAAVIIFVVGSAVLAIAIIYNITSISINERKREIATLRVLGYNRFEVNSMIMVENLVITLLGCALGIPCGYGMFVYLLSITTGFDIYFATNLTFLPVLISVGLTFVFSLLATFLLQRRVNRISMVEALKSVE